jgi:hypothetical protein
MARYILNEQFVRGINLIEAMYISASSTPGRSDLPSFMADPGYPALMRYASRMSYLMSSGRPAASVALLLPTSSLWMGDTNANSMFVSTERLLSERQVDFDIVSEDAINQTLKPVPGALETMSGNRLRTVIVPAASVLSSSTVSVLRKLVARGGHVLFVGGVPTQIADRSFLEDHTSTAKDFAWATVNTVLLKPTPTPPAQAPNSPPPAQEVPAELNAELQKTVAGEDLVLENPDVALRYTNRTLDGGTVFLLFNESSRPIHNRLALRSKGGTIEIWDAQTGTRKPAPGATFDKGRIEVPLDLAPFDTEILVVTNARH